jgi:AcrR family transcriptional regulator
MTTAVQRSRRREQRERVRARILDAAAQLLRTRPYREVSIDQLMASVGVTRTIFYRYFDDLPDLVVRLLDEASAELLEEERRLMEAGVDTPAAVRQALVTAIEVFREHGPLLRAVAEAASHDEHIEQGFGALLGRFERLIEDYLLALASRGHGRLSEPHEAARALNLMNVHYLLGAFGTPEPAVSAEAALQTLTELWVGAVLASDPPPST